MTPLGQKVRELRQAMGISQMKLAGKGQFSPSLVSGLELGIRSYVTAQDIQRLAEALDVPEDVLWETIPGGKTDARWIRIVS